MKPTHFRHPLPRARGLFAPALLLAVALTGCPCAATAAAATEDVTRLLAQADQYRTGADNLAVETQVLTVDREGRADKERRYTVYAQSGRRSLVLMRSPAEAGQKVLMLGDDFWLLMPGSQRPLRITPSQKLLGDASTGDIATLRWAEDYAGIVAGTEPCAADPGAASAPADGPGTCLHLSLQARRKGVSYQRIELWLGQRHHEPVRAELYLQSDKLAKLARFVTDQAARPTRVDEMVLSDRLSNHKETRVRYLSRQPRAVPESWLNPMALARHPDLE